MVLGMSTTEQSTPTAARRQVSPSKAEVAEARALSKEAGLDYVDLDRYRSMRSDVLAAPTGLPPSPCTRSRLEVRHAGRSGVASGRHHGDGRPPDDHRRDIHAVVACESQIDAYIERVYARAEGQPRSRSRDTRHLRERHEDSVRFTVSACGVSGSACGAGSSFTPAPPAPETVPPTPGAESPRPASDFEPEPELDILAEVPPRRTHLSWARPLRRGPKPPPLSGLCPNSSALPPTVEQAACPKGM